MKFYKGFDKDLKCKDLQYTVGSITYKNSDNSDNHATVPEDLPANIKDRVIDMCTNQGYHFCSKISDVFSYYKNNGENRFCEIEVLGFLKEDSVKSCSNAIKIVKELTSDDISKIIEEDKLKKSISYLQLDVVRGIQEKYPLLHIGGSVGLFLHGCLLKRDSTVENFGDLDFVSPYFILPESWGEFQVTYEGVKSSGNDFDETFMIDTGNKTIVVDYKIDPKQGYEIIEYEGFKYKVSKLETIWEAKLRYALMGNDKHLKDLYHICGKTK